MPPPNSTGGATTHAGDYHRLACLSQCFSPTTRLHERSDAVDDPTCDDARHCMLGRSKGSPSGIADARIEGTAIPHDHVGQKTCLSCTIVVSMIAICASTRSLIIRQLT